MLLGSPPDTVHGRVLRRPDPSSLLTWVRRHSMAPGVGIRPCCSGLQVQGTAISPVSAALPWTGLSGPSQGDTLTSYNIFPNLSTRNSPSPRKKAVGVPPHLLDALFKIMQKNKIANMNIIIQPRRKRPLPAKPVIPIVKELIQAQISILEE